MKKKKDANIPILIKTISRSVENTRTACSGLPFRTKGIFWISIMPSTELLLSDAFQKPDLERLPSIECRVRILNINQGHNRELMERCRRLREYAEFIEYIRKYLKDGMKILEAVSGAMDICEEQGILTDLLTRCRTEVPDMLLAKYNEKKTIAYIRKEERDIEQDLPFVTEIPCKGDEN